ncbi:uncharacterized protein HKW66_Vig0010080 [Vigna angularis]|uniref:Uncharacterized protein n=1 Tax=Phaseolus angularis TaxID=3914 RepID=A0A8T0LID9_PHAAN|nr:uncharacterized protein HKW66_Vig0010080 [Vigna angularis]
METQFQEMRGLDPSKQHSASILQFQQPQNFPNKTVAFYLGFILAAIDAAMADDVDVVSLRVRGAVVTYHLDEIAIGAFGATLAGVFVPPQLAMTVPMASQ